MGQYEKLKGRVAVVTGGAGGIGKEICKCLSNEGAQVIMADLSESSAANAIAEINSAYNKVIYHELDVVSEQSWHTLYQYVEQRFSRLDILVNNAGIYLFKDIENTTLDDWNRVMSINATGVFLGTKLAIPLLRQNGSGSIINMSSTSGITGSPFEVAYTASKGSVRLFTKSAALYTAKDNIRINSVHPATTDTSMVEVLWESNKDLKKTVTENVPLGRLADPIEIAKAILFLASDDSSYITGTELIVDGGMTAI
ncbi:MAG: 3alpha(or 20beta)-hydroxysteroid dehydrogenase [Chloroflexi bacterium]|jgi:NAD(P)-dependent dehydrogenase (short-subunit alcohol dehydrogenase family)|nr:MAG: 3alpha(or 20beta)-hydroxysteroid dehydrogenase [Chloroflexota bacterium]